MKAYPFMFYYLFYRYMILYCSIVTYYWLHGMFVFFVVFLWSYVITFKTQTPAPCIRSLYDMTICHSLLLRTHKKDGDSREIL